MRKEIVTQRILAFFTCLLVIFCFGAAGEICGFVFKDRTKAFANIYPDNNPKDIRHVLKTVNAAGGDPDAPWNSAGLPIGVFTVKGAPRAVEAYNLQTGAKLWRVDEAVSSPVTVAGDLAIWKSGKHAAAYRLTDGTRAWRYKLDDGWDFYGADANGKIAALTVGVGGAEPGGYANGKIVIVDAESGFTQWEHNAGSGLLGKPTVIKNLVFAPWERQKIVVINVDEGEEICRLRAEDYAINFITKTKGALYHGSLAAAGGLGAVYRFNAAAASGTAEGSDVFSPKLKPVPGDPNFGEDAYALSSGGRFSEERIRFHYKPSPENGGTIKFEGDNFYLHYWGYIIAFDAISGQVRWTYRADESIESMDVVSGGGILTVSAGGTVRYIDPKSGTETWQSATGAQVLTAAFDADGFVPARATQPPVSPAESLTKLITDRDNRLLPIRVYAVGLLAAIPKPEITRTLLEIYSDRSSPKMLRLAIVKAVEKRTTGAEYLVSALDMKYDYLEGTQSPPMKIVAPALINMKERDAVPSLLDHLMNHETPQEDLVGIIAALHALGDASVVAPLTKFLTWYHADTSFVGHEETLASAAYTLKKYGDKAESEAFIGRIRDDAQTLPELKRLLRAVLDPETVAREAAEAKAAEEAAAREAEEKARLAAEAAFVPEKLSREQINETIVRNKSHLAPCILDAMAKESTLRQIRLRFSISGPTGQASDLKVLPNNIEGLESCLSEAFGKFRFRQAKVARQLATYTISISPPKTPDE